MPDINITERPLGSLFSDLTQETASLFRNELRLARAELTNKARQARRGAAEVAVSVVFFLVGLGVLAAAAVLGLAIVVQPWLAAVIVGVVALIIGGVLLAVGLRSMRANSLAPRRTMGTLRDNTRWAREQLR
ncbi:MAG TPA: phage holin family protein [Magnetospirillum sp.]|jgi:hypothetical protein|nr:phage holin family protein [Magnetospirillum sp.]